MSEGQAIAPQLRYARLSSVLVGIAISQIVKIPGAPSAAACPVAGAPPPPPPPTVAPIVIPISPPGQSPTPQAVTPGGPGTTTNRNGEIVNKNGKPLTPAQAKLAAVALKAVAKQQAVQAQAKHAAELKDEIDSELAAAAIASHKSSGGGTSTIWIVVVGVGLAWAATEIASRRKKVA